MADLNDSNEAYVSFDIKKINKQNTVNVNDLTINTILDTAVSQYRNKVYCVSQDHPENILTFNQLKQLVDAERAYFAKSKEKKIVAFFLQNSVAFVINFLAVVCNGAVAVIVDARNEIEFILKQLNDVKPNIIVTTQEAAEKIRQAWIEFKFDYELPEFKIVTLDHAYFKKNSDAPIEANIELPSATTDSLAVILYTSGSVGHPKGVMLTHNAICNSVYQLSKNVNKKYLDCQLAVAPFSHIAGLTGIVLFSILMGVRIVFLESVKPDIMLSAIKQNKAQFLLVPPVFLEMIYRKINEKISTLSLFKRTIIKLFQTFVFIISYFSEEYGHLIARKLFKEISSSIGESLGVFYSAGANIPKKIPTTLFSFGFITINCYGLSETSGVIVMNSNMLKFPSSVGKVNSNISVKISEPDNQGIGEIYVKGNQVFNGYYNNKLLTDACLKDGWLNTGDLGYFDKKSYLYVVGRNKDVIITAEGKKIYPSDLEEFFMDVPGIEMVCAFGLKVGDNDHVAICFQIPASDFNIAKKNIIQLVSKKNNKLPSYMRIQHIFVESEPMPLSKNGKVLKKVLAEKYQNLLQK